MSFNLNRLVQPECGGANPLVSEAHQIALQPSARVTGSRVTGQRQNTVNFSQEFMQNQSYIMSPSALETRTQVSGPRQASAINNPTASHHVMPHHHHHHDHHHQQPQQQQGQSGSLDDPAFWHALSQHYIGPSTYDNIAKMRASRAAASSDAKLEGQPLET